MKYHYQDKPVPKEWTTSPAFMGVNPICLKIMAQRGIQSTEDARLFLFPKFQEVVQNTDIQGMNACVDTMEQAIQAKDHIVIYQDYDVDGCAACAIMMENLRRFGAIVDFYGNDRSIDGYGLCKNGIDQILLKFPEAKLIVTVDNGIVAYEGIEYANSKGLKVLVTDHHEPGDTLPPAVAVVDLKRKDETYPFHDLCGAGLALKVMFALGKKMRRDLGLIAQSTDLAAFATVADVVPMVGENRSIVREGLKYINDGIRPAFRMMNAVIDEKRVTAQGTLAFKYAPMINAVSRMGYDTGMIVEMFLDEDLESLKRTVLALDQINDERKEETLRENEIAESVVDPTTIGKAIVIQDESFQEGVIGIVAGRLKEQYHRPVIVFAKEDNGTMKASGRSVPGFNLKTALDQMAPLMIGYGGHAMAAGLTIKAENLDDFTKAFLEIADREVDLSNCDEEMSIDVILSADDVSVDLVQGITALEPFGEGFREPCIGLTAEVDNVSYMKEKHVKYTDTKNNLAIITWNGAEKAKAHSSMPKKFVGTLGLNEFHGRVSVQMITIE